MSLDSTTVDPREASLAKPRPPVGPSTEEVLASFDYHTPTPAQARRIEGIRAAFKLTAQAVMELCLPSADRTAAIRQLHEAMMTANKSIVLERVPEENLKPGVQP